jgi:hypothetical protein
MNWKGRGRKWQLFILRYDPSIFMEESKTILLGYPVSGPNVKTRNSQIQVLNTRWRPLYEAVVSEMYQTSPLWVHFMYLVLLTKTHIGDSEAALSQVPVPQARGDGRLSWNERAVVRFCERRLLRQALQKLLFGLRCALSQMFIRALELLHAVKTGYRGSATKQEIGNQLSSFCSTSLNKWHRPSRQCKSGSESKTVLQHLGDAYLLRGTTALTGTSRR